MQHIQVGCFRRGGAAGQKLAWAEALGWTAMGAGHAAVGVGAWAMCGGWQGGCTPRALEQNQQPRPRVMWPPAAHCAPKLTVAHLCATPCCHPCRRCMPVPGCQACEQSGRSASRETPAELLARPLEALMAHQEHQHHLLDRSWKAGSCHALGRSVGAWLVVNMGWSRGVVSGICMCHVPATAVLEGASPDAPWAGPTMGTSL